MLILDYVKENKSGESHLMTNIKTSSQLSTTRLPDEYRRNLTLLSQYIGKAKCPENKKFIRIKEVLNFLLVSEYNPNCEDTNGQYITILKILVRELSPTILPRLFNPETKEFPVLRLFLKLGHHEDIMIKNAARLSLLRIFKDCEGDVMEFIVLYGVPMHFISIISYLTSLVPDLQELVGNVQTRQMACCKIEEEFEYINDILDLENRTISEKAQSIFLNEFIIPVIFSSIAGCNFKQNQTQGTKSRKTGMLLLDKLINAVTNRTLKEEILIAFLLPIEFNRAAFDRIGIDLDANLLRELRDRTYKELKDTISRSEMNSLLYVMRIVCAVVETLLSFPDRRIYLLYTTYIEPLMERFGPEVRDFSKSENTKLNLMALALGKMAKVSAKSNELHWMVVKKSFSKVAHQMYLKTCQQFTPENALHLASIIDEKYNEFVKNRAQFERLIDKRRYFSEMDDNVESFQFSKHSKADIILIKLFHLRSLCLYVNNKEDRILPLLLNEIKIGDKVALGESMPCEKLIYGRTYANKHYLKVTSSQILILQEMGNRLEAIVIFSSYHKDTLWSIDSKDCLQIWKFGNKTSSNRNRNCSAISIQLRFKNSCDLSVLSNLIPKAKKIQNETLQKKLDDLFEVEFIKTEM